MADDGGDLTSRRACPPLQEDSTPSLDSLDFGTAGEYGVLESASVPLDSDSFSSTVSGHLTSLADPVPEGQGWVGEERAVYRPLGYTEDQGYSQGKEEREERWVPEYTKETYMDQDTNSDVYQSDQVRVIAA